MEGIKKPAIALNDQERFPLIGDLSLLNNLKQDAFAPVFNFQSGDRLSQQHLDKIKEYAENIRGHKKFWDQGEQPLWMDQFLTWCKSTVPFYKDRSESLLKQPTITRYTLSQAPWEFVSSEVSLDDLLVYHTSGSTGAAMNVLTDPVSQACWIAQLQSILDQHSIRLETGSDKVAIALICSQNSTLTYASLSTYLEGAGVLKINLHPNDWRDPSHITSYLEKYNPQVLTGDPFAFSDLVQLKPKLTPKVLVSSAMKLTNGVRQKLESYFQCPVLDIYSMTECRMVAVADNNRYRAIRPELYLEIFDKDNDILLPYGERGELVITGRSNSYLPLIRYRTGDFCKLEIENGIPYLVDLEARMPVIFYSKQGKKINNVDISREMNNHPLVGFTLHQGKDLNLSFVGWGDESGEKEIKRFLVSLFGSDLTIDVEVKKVTSDRSFKSVVYTSDIPFENE